ncbi:MazG-like family protein (plasmid) [Halorutilales archaeon Cl-col2-1]
MTQVNTSSNYSLAVKFHTPKNIATSITVEAAELLELFQWHGNFSPSQIKENSELMDEIEDELADILLYCMSMAIHLDIDLEEAVERKLEKNKERYNEERDDEIREELEEWQE